MVDCVSDEHFNSTLKILMSHWPIKGFSSYFLRFQAEIICDGLTFFILLFANK